MFDPSDYGHTSHSQTSWAPQLTYSRVIGAGYRPPPVHRPARGPCLGRNWELNGRGMTGDPSRAMSALSARLKQPQRAVVAVQVSGILGS